MAVGQDYGRTKQYGIEGKNVQQAATTATGLTRSFLFSFLYFASSNRFFMLNGKRTYLVHYERGSDPL